jgi:hypothetical protein
MLLLALYAAFFMQLYSLIQLYVKRIEKIYMDIQKLHRFRAGPHLRSRCKDAYWDSLPAPTGALMKERLLEDLWALLEVSVVSCKATGRRIGRDPFVICCRPNWTFIIRFSSCLLKIQ